MKVLHLPVNVASQMSATVRGLRAIGVDATGLVVSETIGNQSNDEIDYLPLISTRFRGRWRLTFALRFLRLLRAMRSADLIHWYMGETVLPNGIDLRLAKMLRKPGIVEFWGSDIRIPEIEAACNPYYARLGPSYEYRHVESYLQSRQRQERFAQVGFQCLIPCESLLPHVQRDLFPKVFNSRQRVLLSDFQCTPPDPAQKRPVIVHSPTAPVCKGTAAVLKAIESLHVRADFDFQLIQNIPRRNILGVIQKADIFLDQFVLGSLGLASIEAMALGKPVVSYISPSMESIYPHDLPVVKASQDNLVDVLHELIADGNRRHELGVRGRAYVEKYHDATKIAHDLVGIYREVMEQTRRHN
jgi:glycosyltransferase involved in cell wall biosynthesis